MDTVLFSPVSDRDPCSADPKYKDVYRDGALLQIVRTHRPQKVYLFLTRRFEELEEKDHRYTNMLRHVCPQVEIELLPCPASIQNAALFDQFDDLFRAHLEAIHAAHPEARLLLNLSSGTPQMQAALYLLAATLTFPIEPVQVLSPSRDSNAGPDRYDPQLAETSLGEDGKITHTDSKGHTVTFTAKRCLPVSCTNAVRTILRENVLKLAESHDYTAALAVYYSSKDLFPKQLQLHLNTAAAHLNLDEEKEQQLRKKPEVDWLDFYEPPLRSKPENFLRCYDYLLYLETLVVRKAYSDYARALSPVLTTIMKLRLQGAGYDIARFCEVDERGITQLKREKVTAEDLGFMEHLDQKYRRTGFRDGPLSALYMCDYMEYLKRQGTDLDTSDFTTLRRFEADIRNLAAHEMKGIPANNEYMTMIKANLRMLRTQFEKAAGTGELQWDALKTMLQKIRLCLDSEARPPKEKMG